MLAPRLKAGDLVGPHWVVVVDSLAIGADGCPEAGDLGCHSVVDLPIKVDGCPKVGDFRCHSVTNNAAVLHGRGSIGPSDALPSP